MYMEEGKFSFGQEADQGDAERLQPFTISDMCVERERRTGEERQRQRQRQRD